MVGAQQFSIPKNDWIARYLDFYENTEPPRIFHEWVGVATIAACLQRKVWLRVRPEETFPNFIIVLVGGSGVGKSSAIRYGKGMLQDGVDGIMWGPNVVSNAGIIMALQESLQQDVFDTEVYAHSSLNVFASEIATFLRPKDEETAKLITDLYDCDPHWAKKTRSHGGEEIENVWLNIIGGTTPVDIGSIFPSHTIGGGLTARIIFVYSDERGAPQAISYPPSQKIYAKLQDDLITFRQLRGQAELSDRWMAEWVAWYNHAYFNPVFPGNDRFTGYNMRRGRHILSLSLVFAASEFSFSDGELVLTANHFIRALDLLERTEKDMPKTFGLHGAGSLNHLYRRVITILELRKTLKMKELYQLLDADISNVNELEETLLVLRRQGKVAMRDNEDTVVLKY